MFLDRLFGGRPKPPEPHRRRPIDPSRTRKSRKLHQKVDVADLRVGMYVVELDIPWEQSDFMLQGFEIRGTEDLERLRQQCHHVFVDFDEYGLQPAARRNGLPAAPVSGLVDLAAFQDDLADVGSVIEFANQTIGNLFSDVRLGGKVEATTLRSAVNGCVDSILRNPDASIWLTRLHAASEATAQHSLNVAALSILLGRTLDMNNGQLEELGVCATLHDIGKTRLPNALVDKPDRLTAIELDAMRLHPGFGRDILLQGQSALSGAADVAYCHHERPDGNGYPRGLTLDDIPRNARIVAIAEAYDAMTTTQPWRPARSPSDALQVLYAERGKQFDEEMVVRFIDAVGIFPPGSIVEMLNGEVGIVLSNTEDKLRPRVILILDAEREPQPQRVADLQTMDADAKGEIYRIRTTHPDGSFGIDVGDFQRAGLRLG